MNLVLSPRKVVTVLFLLVRFISLDNRERTDV